ncbi:DUF3574 domain-containing protein [Phototrophicus methaneseepsis]|uniref:DUF3574 domain-containing protein n=1 Tax=Phototrophicus methaneseepsis TaxID=2710758 RepID=A0A7S8E866_9CHLR|nr:DUF3574 domain-containing protein [Phototrophicus methaneseepsis]QPC82097.1 DUF3574 domain-containing protein [Phototrophicus methaneseepsis]
MKGLQVLQMFENGLSHRVAILIPSTNNVSESLTVDEHTQYVELYLRLLSERFGGATAASKLGAWIDDDGQLIRENITEVYAFASEITSDDLVFIQQAAMGLKDELAQEAIAVEIDNKLYFV